MAARVGVLSDEHINLHCAMYKPIPMSIADNVLSHDLHSSKAQVAFSGRKLKYNSKFSRPGTFNLLATKLIDLNNGDSSTRDYLRDTYIADVKKALEHEMSISRNTIDPSHRSMAPQVSSNSYEPLGGGTPLNPENLNVRGTDPVTPAQFEISTPQTQSTPDTPSYTQLPQGADTRGSIIPRHYRLPNPEGRSREDTLLEETRRESIEDEFIGRLSSAGSSQPLLSPEAKKAIGEEFGVPVDYSDADRVLEQGALIIDEIRKSIPGSSSDVLW